MHKLNWIIMMAVNDSSVQFGTFFINTRFWEVVGLLKEVGFQAPLELFFGQGGGRQMQMFRTTVPDDWSNNVETGWNFICRVSLLFLTRPHLHGLPETGSAREIRHCYSDSDYVQQCVLLLAFWRQHMLLLLKCCWESIQKLTIDVLCCVSQAGSEK